MIAPMDYALFSEIHDSIFDLVSTNLEKKQDEHMFDYRQRLLRNFEDAMDEFGRKCPSLSVICFDGRIFRISGEVLAFRRFGYGGLGSEVARYSFIDREFGVIDTTRVGHWAAQAEEHISLVRPKYDEARKAEVKSGQGHSDSTFALAEQWSGAAATIEDGKSVNFLLGVHGWSVVCKLEDVPNAITYFEVAIESSAEEHDLNHDASGNNDKNQKRTGGRPRQRDDLAMVYRGLFPNGHEVEGLVWKDVVREITPIVGRHFHISTLQRGLANEFTNLTQNPTQKAE